MKPKVIKTEQDYEQALQIIDSLMDATPGSPEEEDLELWSLLVENYEAQAFPIDPPSAVEAIRFRMEQMGLKRKDLEPYLHGKNRVSEVLSGKRPLTLRMIRSLQTGLGISADILVR